MQGGAVAAPRGDHEPPAVDSLAPVQLYLALVLTRCEELDDAPKAAQGRVIW